MIIVHNQLHKTGPLILNRSKVIRVSTIGSNIDPCRSSLFGDGAFASLLVKITTFILLNAFVISVDHYYVVTSQPDPDDSVRNLLHCVLCISTLFSELKIE